MADAVAAGDARLVLSTVVLAEIIPSRSLDGVGDALEEFILAPGVTLAPADERIARRASAVREAGHAERPERKLRTPDALILATAILHADVLHSADRHMLAVGGGPVVGGFPITPPSLPAA